MTALGRQNYPFPLAIAAKVDVCCAIQCLKPWTSDAAAKKLTIARVTKKGKRFHPETFLLLKTVR
jgi:hypothetical protein